MNAFKKVIVGIVTVAGAQVATATYYNVSSVGDFAGSYAADTVRYLGGSATLSAALQFATTARKSATTIDIVNSDAKLTFTGKPTGTNDATSATGAFIKSGPGELCWAASDSFTFKGYSGDHWGGNLYATKWDENGSAYQGFSRLQVAGGTFTLNAPGKTFTAGDSYVGNYYATPTQATLRVINGTLNADNVLTVCYGAKTTGDETPYTIYIGANGLITTPTLWQNFCCRQSVNPGNALVDIDGGKLTITTKGNNMRGYGASKILVHNSGMLDFNNATAGCIFQYPYNHNQESALFMCGSTNYTIEANNATVKATAIGGDANGHFIAKNGATVQIDRTNDKHLRWGTGPASAEFDGATLSMLRPTIFGDWFSGLNDLIIGEDGLTVTVDNAQLLDGTSRGEGTITKNGAGSLAMQAGGADVQVNAGSAAFTIANDGTKLGRDGTISAATGTKVYVGGDNALASMTLNAGAQENVFTPTKPTYANLLNDWTYFSSAVPRPDGWVRLTDPLLATTNLIGAIWAKTKMDLTSSFTITYDYAVSMTSTLPGRYNPYGMSVGWQNLGTGYEAHGKWLRGNGWGNSTPAWKDTFAFSYDAANCSLHYSVNGGFTVNTACDTYTNSVHGTEWNGTLMQPQHFKIVYDATKHVATFTEYNYAWTKASVISTEINLAEACGDEKNEAWFGFSGGGVNDSNNKDYAKGSHFVSNIRINYSDPTPVTTEVGGNVAIAAGGTFKATLEQDDVQKGWVLDSIACAGDATVNVSGPSDATLTAKSVTGADALTKTGTGAFGVTAGSAVANSIAVNAGSLAVTRINPYTEPLAQTAANWQVQTNLGGLAYTLKSSPKDFPKRYSQFVNNGFAIGRSSNANVRDNARFDSRTRIKVNTDWEITYGLKTEYYNVNHNAGFYGVCFHNDSRAPNGVALSDSGEAQPNFCHGIGNCAAIVWGAANAGGSNGYGNKVAVATGSAILKTSSSDWRETSPVIMGHKRGDSNNGNFETNCTVKLSYAASTKTLTIYMKQPKWEVGATDPTYSEKTIVFENFDIPTAVGGDYAYISFGANTTQAWYGLLTTITDFAYVDKSATFEAAATVSVGANATLVYGGDTSGSTVAAKLATTLNAADGATIKIASGATIGADTLAAGGKLVIDGGTYKFTSADAVSGLKRLYLNNGAKVYIPEGVTIKLSRLFIDGVRQDTVPTDTVVGGGELTVASSGMIIFLQ